MKSAWQSLNIVRRFQGEPAGYRKAQFFYVSVYNRRGRNTAENVVPYVTVSLPKWRDAGAMPLLVIARPASIFYLVDGIANETDDADRFARALIESEEYRARTMALSGGGKQVTFVLLLTVKGSSKLYIPTAGPIPASATVLDPKFKLDLYLEVQDMPIRHAKTYYIDPKAMLSTSDATKTS